MWSQRRGFHQVVVSPVSNVKKKRSRAGKPTCGAPKGFPAVGNPPGRFIVNVLCYGSPSNSVWAPRYSIFLPNSLNFLDSAAQIRIWGGYLQLKMTTKENKYMKKSKFVFFQNVSYYDSGGSYHSKTCFYNSETIFSILNPVATTCFGVVGTSRIVIGTTLKKLKI